MIYNEDLPTFLQSRIHNLIDIKDIKYWAAVVAQLVDRSFLTSEIRGSNPVIGKFIYHQLY